MVAVLGAALFAFWVAMAIWTFNDIQNAQPVAGHYFGLCAGADLPVIGLILYMLIRPKDTLAEVYDRALEEEALLREIEETLSCLLRGTGQGRVGLLPQLPRRTATRLQHLSAAMCATNGTSASSAARPRGRPLPPNPPRPLRKTGRAVSATAILNRTSPFTVRCRCGSRYTLSPRHRTPS